MMDTQNSNQLVTVKLYGHLGKRFGRVHRLAIRTPNECIRALSANFNGFRQYMIEHSAPGYRVITDMGERSVEQLSDPMGGKSIKIIPVVAGAGNGVGQFILGAVLFVVGEYVTVDSFGVATPFGQGLANVGIYMMVGGVSQMLFAPPVHQPNNNPSGSLPSYAFNGPVNTVAQGNPVPVCYGRMRVGSQVISGGEYATQL